MNHLEALKKQGKAPEWMTEEAYLTLSKNKREGKAYLLPNEEPIDLYKRISKRAQELSPKIPDLEKKVFEFLWKGYLCLATPVATNFGTDRGLGVSCFGQHTPDSIDGIYQSEHETAMLIKHGGGIGRYYGDVRPAGARIGEIGESVGIVPALKVLEQTSQYVAQAGVRRGAVAAYLPVWHNDIDSFIDIRRPSGGDPSRKCLSTSFHHGVVIPDDFMENLKNRPEYLNTWTKLLQARTDTGEPYLMFIDNANRQAPDCYGKYNLKIKTSQLCNEVYLPSDEEHTFICCLSSINLSKWDEMPQAEVTKYGIYLLDAVIEDFIERGQHIAGFEKAVRFARKSRAVGLGALGWHTYLQKFGIPFESFESMMENNKIFSTIQKYSIEASKELAKLYGECEWTQGFGLRNTNLNAIAPTTSNSLISGGISQGIEPIIANYYSQKSAKGTFIRKNPTFEQLLINKGKNNFKVWASINEKSGSIQHLDFLTKREKEIFKTAKEIDQNTIITQASQRQKYIDQGQSTNLFFACPDTSNQSERELFGKYIHQVHYKAWEMGLKGLYYCRMTSTIKGDNVFKMMESSCKSCES